MFDRRRFLMFAGAGAACAQDSPALRNETLKGTVLMHNAPLDPDVVRVRTEQCLVQKLSNGMEVLLVENHRLPIVAFDFAIPSSTLSDPVELAGRAETTALMLREDGDIGDRIAEIGMSLTIAVDYGARSTHIYAECFPENLESAIGVIADMLVRPRFTEDSLAQWKQRKKTQTQQLLNSPLFVTKKVILRRFFAGDSRRHTAITLEGLNAIGLTNLTECYDRFYKPSGTLAGATGDFDAPRVAAMLESRFATWSGAAPTIPGFPAPQRPASRNAFLIDRPNAVQATLLFGDQGVDRRSPDYFACVTMNRVLGEGQASRLWRNIREDKGYSYQVASSFTSMKHLQYFTAAATVRPESARLAIEAFQSEFQKVRDVQVRRDELEQAKHGIMAGLALSFEQQASVLRHLMVLREYDLPLDYWDSYANRIASVTGDDVKRAAQVYMHPERMQLAAAGDARDLERGMKEYSPVTRLDWNGDDPLPQ
jgi:zinc protease